MNSAGVKSRAETFEELLAPVLGVAYGVARRLSRNDGDAEDLVQEAALLAYRSFDSFQAGTNFKAWYLRILKNCFFMRVRTRRGRSTTVALEDAPPLYLLMQTANAGWTSQIEDPSTSFLRTMTAEQVAEALHELPEEFRLVCTLYFMEDFSYEEIAEVVECPIGTVRSRLHRGRRMLQKALWHVAESHGVIEMKGVHA